MSTFELISLDTRMATDDDAHIHAYDHTKLSNINTCPTWGILRYSHHKRMPGASRAMALEAGAASHEGFAAVRWYQFYTRQATTNLLKDVAMKEGARIFGSKRFRKMYDVIDTSQGDRTNLINFTLEALYSYDFYDDPSDTKRTISNISEGLICYVDAYDLERYPIYISDALDPKATIGVEIAYDIVVDIKYKFNSKLNAVKYRFTGKLDGLHWDRDRLMIQEDKTGARLDDSWLSQWVLSHQITGYAIAAATFTGEECTRAQVSGMKIPIARNPMDTIRKETVNRSQDPFFNKWAEWFIHTAEMDQTYRDDIISAPMYTTSCNRYFRACSFVPFCVGDTEEKKLILEEMVIDEWSPLHDDND
jgi:hypothetical protein